MMSILIGSSTLFAMLNLEAPIASAQKQNVTLTTILDNLGDEERWPFTGRPVGTTETTSRDANRN